MQRSLSPGLGHPVPGFGLGIFMQTPFVGGFSVFVFFEGKTPLSTLARLPQVMAREHDEAACLESVVIMA